MTIQFCWTFILIESNKVIEFILCLKQAVLSFLPLSLFWLDAPHKQVRTAGGLHEMIVLWLSHLYDIIGSQE